MPAASADGVWPFMIVRASQEDFLHPQTWVDPFLREFQAEVPAILGVSNQVQRHDGDDFAVAQRSIKVLMRFGTSPAGITATICRVLVSMADTERAPELET